MEKYVFEALHLTIALHDSPAATFSNDVNARRNIERLQVGVGVREQRRQRETGVTSLVVLEQVPLEL